LAWQYAPFANPQAVREALVSIASYELAPAIVVVTFIVAGFVMFPVTVLIAATAATFGPWLGFSYAAVGALASALATYAVGAAIGKRTLRDFLGPRLNRIRRQAAKRGVITMAALRMVPIAPFTVVNLVAGASSIPVFDYMAGTLLGMLPGLIMISAVGHQFARILTAPSATDFAWLAVAVIAWVALSIGVQALVARYWSGGR
jgi:phospholipase D1/2